jgi:hypothetical protein
MSGISSGLAASLFVVGLCACSRTDMNKGRGHDAGRDGSTSGDTMVALTLSEDDVGKDSVDSSPDLGADAQIGGDLVPPGPDLLASPDGLGDATNIADDCVIAIRTDRCCSVPFATSRVEMQQDPCIQPLDSPTFLVACTAKWPGLCDTTDCELVVPPSRVVGRGPGGACQFLSECETTDDCIWAIDIRDCCGCPAYYPRVLVEANDCLQDPANPSGTSCDYSICSSVKCAIPVCSYLPPACMNGDTQPGSGLKVCKMGT